MSLMNRRALTGSTLFVLAAVFIALLMLSSLLFRGWRLDLTQDRLYTLSEGTRNLIGKIDEPVRLRMYFSESAAKDYPALRTYANRVREMLEEMVAVSAGKLSLEVLDPQPFSEDEDRATAAGLQAVPLGASGESLFFGLAGSNALDGQAAIPFFQPDKETFLEYDIAKLISSLAEPERPVMAVISGLNIKAGVDPATGQMTQGWVINEELSKLFTVRALESNVSQIAEDVQLLALIHPKQLSEDTLYAIDQFVLRGGRLLVFVDPNAESEQQGAGNDPMSAMFADKSSNLQTLFKAWGVQFDPAKVVLDAENALQIQTQPDAAPQRHLAILGLASEDLNQQDVISAQLKTLNLSTAGFISLAEDSPLQLEALAQSSGNAATIPTERVRFVADPRELFADFNATGDRYVLAGRLSGSLKTAFPQRSGEAHRAESEVPASIVVVADTDILTDRLWVQVQSFFGQRVMNAFANNGDFVINAADNMVGSSDLIQIRARGSSSRPFTTVEALKRQADDRFRAKEQELQSQLDETERQLTDLQAQKTEGNAMLLSPEQQDAIERFQAEKLRIRKELREVRHDLDSDIRRLGNKLKFINIAGVPILLTALALCFGWSRARRRRGGAA